MTRTEIIETAARNAADRIEEAYDGVIDEYAGREARMVYAALALPEDYDGPMPTLPDDEGGD